MKTRPWFRAPCAKCGVVTADGSTVVLILCPERPALKHLTFECPRCLQVRKTACPDDLGAQQVAFLGGVVRVLHWAKELDDLRRHRPDVITEDEFIEFGRQVMGEWTV